MKTLEEIKKELRNKLWQYTSNHYGKVAVEWDIFMGKVEEEFESAIKKAVEEAIKEERVKGFRQPAYGVGGGWEVYMGIGKDNADLDTAIDILERAIEKQWKFENDLLNYDQNVKGKLLKGCPFPNEDVTPYRLSDLYSIRGTLLRLNECLYILRQGMGAKESNDKIKSAD